MTEINVEPEFDVFPNNVVQAVTAVLEGCHPAFDGHAFPRQLRPTDPNPCIGVFPALWIPVQESLEMGHHPVGEPTFQRYTISVQALNKDADKDIALARHSTIATLVRRTLYRSDPLRVMLRSLTANDGGVQESFRKLTIGTQRFLSNDVNGQFVFLSVLDLTLETEIR